MSNDHLSQLNKEELIEIINTKTTYLSMIVHQLRTPLTAEKWFLEMLCSGHLGITIPHDKHEFIEKASGNIDNALKLLRELSLANQTETWKMHFSPEKKSIKEILEKSIALFSVESLSKHISLVLRSDQNYNYESMVDPDKIGIVFQNIIENAIKYSPNGSTVEIQLEQFSESIVVMVTDHGIGIPFDDQKHVFNRLYRASNTQNTPGTGLGLSIAKEICQYHHSSIWFESIPDIGTTFFVKLPKI